MLSSFPPVRFAALRRALCADAARYARSRSHVDGAVTRLSPYLTHGLITTGEILDCWRLRFGLTLRDRLCQELAWREFFQHVWRHRAAGILDDLQPTVHAIDRSTPLAADIRHAATGIPLVDRCVRELYATGYLHHQQRLWLASYCLHVRKQSWRSAADWMYGHLLDGDLASNHLSWQWVAGQFGNKPHLLTNENIRRYAPELDSPGAPFDRSYAAMEQLVASSAMPPAPAILHRPTREPPLLARPPGLLATPNLAQLARGRKLALIHPWMLERRPQADLRVGIIHLPFHASFPWSAARWHFVLARMHMLCDVFFIGDLAQSHQWLDQVDIAASEDTLNFGYADALRHERIQLADAPRALPEPGAQCASFGAWMKTLLRNAPELFDRSLADQLAGLRRNGFPSNEPTI